jgi:hypothetical protein
MMGSDVPIVLAMPRGSGVEKGRRLAAKRVPCGRLTPFGECPLCHV